MRQIKSLWLSLLFIAVGCFLPNMASAYAWTKSMGGASSTGSSTCLTIDAYGNVYVTGFYSGTVDFNPDPIATDNHVATGSDVFLTRFNADGSYAWTKSMGGTGTDSSNSVSVDSYGNIFITGSYSATVDFNPDPIVADNHTSISLDDIFLTKFNADGSYAWTKSMGGTGTDSSNSVSIDTYGNVYVTGIYWGTVDFNPDPVATDNKTSAGNNDVFLTRFNADGSYAWTKSMGGMDQAFSNSISIDTYGNVYVTGFYSGTVDFNPDPVATDNHTATGILTYDIFLTRFNADGSYAWTKSMGGSSSSYSRSVSTDAYGNVYITGYYTSTVDFNPDPIATDNHKVKGLNDIFLTRFNADGSYAWTKTISGTGSSFSRSVSIDTFGNVYITGSYSGTVDFNPAPNAADTRTPAGSDDIFLTRFNADGSYAWTKSMGGTSKDRSNSTLIDTYGNVYVTGYFQGTADFNPDPIAVDDLTPAGLQDIFLAKLDVTAPVTSDITAPVISLLGLNPHTLNVGQTYTDAGATAFDLVDGDITGNISVVNNVNTAIAGAYTVTYNVSDVAGNAAVQVTRTVTVVNAVNSSGGGGGCIVPSFGTQGLWATFPMLGFMLGGMMLACRKES